MRHSKLAIETMLKNASKYPYIAICEASSNNDEEKDIENPSKRLILDECSTRDEETDIEWLNTHTNSSSDESSSDDETDIEWFDIHASSSSDESSSDDETFIENPSKRLRLDESSTNDEDGHTHYEGLRALTAEELNTDPNTLLADDNEMNQWINSGADVELGEPGEELFTWKNPV